MDNAKALREFNELAEMILAVDYNNQKEAVIASQIIYDLKAYYFKHITLRTIKNDGLIKDQYCPLCNMYISDICIISKNKKNTKCPLFQCINDGHEWQMLFEVVYSNLSKKHMMNAFNNLYARINKLKYAIRYKGEWK